MRLVINKWWLSADFAADAAKSPSRCRARAPTKRTHNLITDLPIHIPKKVKNLAVRRELVFDECVGASRLRRQAHVFFDLTKQIDSSELCLFTRHFKADCFLKSDCKKSKMTILRVPVLIQAASLRSAETGTLSFTKQTRPLNQTKQKQIRPTAKLPKDGTQRQRGETAAFALTRSQIAAVFFASALSVCVSPPVLPFSGGSV